MFHAFYMYVYFVAMLCAGRFGLGWAHDAFQFACHLVMRFHAYVPSCFYHLILKLLGTFLIISLSLSPSYISCIMASKHKSTPSQNHLRSEASSSSSPSDPTPSHVRFCDEKATSDFLENFSRAFIQNAKVIMLDFFNTDLPTVIHSKGWESFCGILVTCPFVIIQEFYSNMHRFDYSIPLFVTHVRGIRIVVAQEHNSTSVRKSVTGNLVCPSSSFSWRSYCVCTP